MGVEAIQAPRRVRVRAHTPFKASRPRLVECFTLDIPVALAGRPLCGDYGGSQGCYDDEPEKRNVHRLVTQTIKGKRTILPVKKWNWKANKKFYGLVSKVQKKWRMMSSETGTASGLPVPWYKSKRCAFDHNTVHKLEHAPIRQCIISWALDGNVVR